MATKAKSSDSDRGLSIAAYARYRRKKGLTGSSEWSIRKALASGRIQRNRYGRIDPAKADRAWKENTQPRLRRNGDGNPVHYAAARARKEEYEAEIKHLELQKMRGELIPVAEARRAQFRFFRALRERMLVIPSRVGPELTGLTIRKLERRLREEIRAGLQELADGELPEED